MLGRGPSNKRRSISPLALSRACASLPPWRRPAQHPARPLAPQPSCLPSPPSAPRSAAVGRAPLLPRRLPARGPAAVSAGALAQRSTGVSRRPPRRTRAQPLPAAPFQPPRTEARSGAASGGAACSRGGAALSTEAMPGPESSGTSCQPKQTKSSRYPAWKRKRENRSSHRQCRESEVVAAQLLRQPLRLPVGPPRRRQLHRRVPRRQRSLDLPLLVQLAALRTSPLRGFVGHDARGDGLVETDGRGALRLTLTHRRVLQNQTDTRPVSGRKNTDSTKKTKRRRSL